MSEKEKRLKLALVRTRRIIAKKFQKLHNQNIKRDVKLNEKYAPITKSLKKIVDMKKDDSNPKKNQASVPSKHSETENLYLDNNLEESVDSSNEDLNENVEPEFDNELAFDDFQPTFTSELNVAGPSRNSINNVQNTVPNKRTSIRSLLERNEVTDTTQFLNSDYDTSDNDFSMRAIASKRRRDESNNDLVDDSENEQQSIRKDVKKVKKCKQNALIIKRKWNDLQNLRAIRRTAMAKIKKKLRPNNGVQQKRSKVVVSPEDFDDHGNFRGAEKPKRRKVLTSSVRYIPVKRKIKRSSKQSSTVGEGIEKEFIPYNGNIVYEYWDDPNELCARLQLLMASQSTGNSNHGQEINSIIQELREQNIIL